MRLLKLVGAASVAGVVYRLVVDGSLTLDTGLGRQVRPLGPITVQIKAPREVVFDAVSDPYLKRTPQALADKLEVVERGSDMVLGAHHTPVGRGRTTTTLETVRFTPPERIDFRLVRGPVPYVVEHFLFTERGSGTTLEYVGQLGTDFWRVGRIWGDVVARKWEATVQQSLMSVQAEAERRAAA